ncbi:MAG: Ldh family oxidoreductase [Deltaproteobacteria bacterium]|nr:Ldh family oxidoreductase [Deltaproteobacteria bacterium]
MTHVSSSELSSRSVALIDGDAGLGHIIANMAMNLAVEKSLASGIVILSVFNSSHFGAAGYFALKAAHRGVIGL